MSTANPFAGTFSDANKMYFRVSKLDKDKNGNPKAFILFGKKDDIQKFDYMEGLLVNIESFKETYEGNIIEKIRFTFRPKSGDTLAILTCGRYTAFTRDVLNCLANLPAVEFVRLTPFVSEDPATNKVYIHGAVKNNGEKIKRKFPVELVPKVKTEYVKQLKKEVLITAERDEFFDNLIPGILAKLAYSENISVVENTVEENEDSLTSDNDEMPY